MATAVRLDDARRVADAVLFEGYLLYPYRASATKNQLRWQFGIVAPPGADTGDASVQQAEVLADGLTDDARIDLCVRFLHLETRRDAVPWDEGRVVEHTCSSTVGELLTADGVTTRVREPAGVRARRWRAVRTRARSPPMCTSVPSAFPVPTARCACRCGSRTPARRRRRTHRARP